MADPERAARFERRMSAGEALMWNVEKDPWLNPSGATVCVLDGPTDIGVVERWLAAMVADVPRLRERVTPGFGRFTPPTWTPDPEFSYHYHVRHIGAAAPGTDRQLLDMTTLMLQEPFDRTRPLWQVVVLHGLADDRSAVYMKVHHSIADGYGTARLQQRFMVRQPDVAPPPVVDLDAVVALTCGQAETERADAARGPLGAVAGLAGRSAALWRRVAADAALTAADPRRLGEVVSGAAGAARMARSQLGGEGGGDAPVGSSLWTGRSRRRHLELVHLPLEDVKQAAQRLGGSVNDAFMTALAHAAASYHHERGAPVDTFDTAFVISTRADSAEGGNSFSPVRVLLPGRPMGIAERFDAVRDRVFAARSSFSGGGLMGGLAIVANLLPTSLTTRVARSGAARVDFATSNVRGSGRPLYIAGRRIESMFALGPVAGSAMNVTALSYAGTLAVALHIDPAAIADAADLAKLTESAFDELGATARH